LPSFIFNHFNNYLKIEFSEIGGKQVCGIRVNKSDEKVFLNIQNKDRFFVRIDASTRELSGEEIVDFCIKRFA
jgi:predicted HTH transcriptional regulator